MDGGRVEIVLDLGIQVLVDQRVIGVPHLPAIEGDFVDVSRRSFEIEDVARVTELLVKSGLPANTTGFKRVASARSLYHWHADAGQEY